MVGDVIQIQQVLVNLTRNAFDALGSAQILEPRVVIQTKRAGLEGVEFCVTDNGEGIDQECLTRVFDAYFSTRAGGMGMGLAISRTIIEAHQGRITIESLRNVSTTFGWRFRLALMTMTEPTVYIVDDDADLRDSLQWLIKTVGLRPGISLGRRFPSRFRTGWARLPDSRCANAGHQRAGPVRGAGCSRTGDARHLYHRICRRTDGRSP